MLSGASKRTSIESSRGILQPLSNAHWGQFKSPIPSFSFSLGTKRSTSNTSRRNGGFQNLYSAALQPLQSKPVSLDYLILLYFII